MTHRTFSTSHQKDEGFRLRLVERSKFRDGIVDAVAWFDEKVTRHRICETRFFDVLWTWSDNAEKVLLILPIDRATADAVAWDDNTWTWLDDDES